MKAIDVVHLVFLVAPCLIGFTSNWFNFFMPCAETEAPISGIDETVAKTYDETATVTPSSELPKPHGFIADTFTDERGPSLTIVATYMHASTATLNLVLFFEARDCCCFWNYFLKWIFPVIISSEVPVYALVGIFYLTHRDCIVVGLSLTIIAIFALIEVATFWKTLCRCCCTKVGPKRDPTAKVCSLFAIQACFFVSRYILLFLAFKTFDESAMNNIVESLLLLGSLLINIRHLLREASAASTTPFWVISGLEIGTAVTSLGLLIYFAILRPMEAIIPGLTIVMLAIDLIFFQIMKEQHQRLDEDQEDDDNDGSLFVIPASGQQLSIQIGLVPNIA